MRPVFDWNLGSRSIQLGKRTLIMGVVNVTPDSFSDGERYFEKDKAVEHALKLIADGADLIDIGGESTRPGAKVVPAEHTADAKTPVNEQEELRRVLPVIAELKKKNPSVTISVDTYKANVARSLPGAVRSRRSLR